MKEYYLQKLHWIFNYTSKNFLYCIAKTLCLIVGVPIYAVAFCVEMILTFVNMIFSWIPVLNVFVMVVCKLIIYLVDLTFYICIIPDLKEYFKVMSSEPEYEVLDDDQLADSNEEQIDTDNSEND